MSGRASLQSALAWCAAFVVAGAFAVVFARMARERVGCGHGFHAVAARCEPIDGCPFPLTTASEGSCVASGRVAVPRTTLTVGASDWEAEGRVASRTFVAGPFWLDAFEVSTLALAETNVPDELRAASGVSRREAEAYCARQLGRLPTEDEWIVAAAGASVRRYPWGDTGAVCRRAAFGLAEGPCARGASGPDTVGSHADGDSPLGIHDLAGNVAEWVAPAPGQSASVGVAKGGSWRTDLAADLRVWATLALDPDAHDDRVGFRCAYDAP